MVKETKRNKLYKCQQCDKEVVADDYNFYFNICYVCEKNSGNSLIKDINVN